jgi:hypothetical protein
VQEPSTLAAQGARLKPAPKIGETRGQGEGRDAVLHALKGFNAATLRPTATAPQEGKPVPVRDALLHAIRRHDANTLRRSVAVTDAPDAAASSNSSLRLSPRDTLLLQVAHYDRSQLQRQEPAAVHVEPEPRDTLLDEIRSFQQGSLKRRRDAASAAASSRASTPTQELHAALNLALQRRFQACQSPRPGAEEDWAVGLASP